MKKLIAILVVFALAMGAAFAEISVSGGVITNVTLAESDTADGTEDIWGHANFKRIRIEASGGNDEGTFGAWLRIGDGKGGGMVDGNAWWKPIDQFLMRIGGNGGDGYYGKEGVTGWMFYQTVTDTEVVFEGENVWGWAFGSGAGGFGAGVRTREAFYGGFGGDGLMLEIKPVDMFGLNIVLPYFANEPYNKVGDILGQLVLQADLNLDFGNIALTYVGGEPGKKKLKTAGSEEEGPYTLDAATGEIKPTKPAVEDVYEGFENKATNGDLFVYAGISAIENVALDVGFGMTLPGEAEGFPFAIGLGAKVTISETFGLKARATAKLGGDNKKQAGAGDTRILFDVLPYFALSDVMTVFVSVGLVMVLPEEGDSETGFHFNPYIQIGSEWGPKFLAGIKVCQLAGVKDAKDNSIIGWAIPIALNIGF